MDFYPGTDFEFANLARETQVIWLAMEGNTDKTIAQLLDITTDTVATYWKRILFRFESSSRTEVVAEFLREYFEDDLDRLETKVKELEQKLKQKDIIGQQQILAAAQLNSLMNLLDVGVLFTNGVLKVSYVNEQLCQMAGCTLKPKELIGQDISLFINNCENRAMSFEMTSEKKIRSLASSSSEKTVDRMAMTDGRTFERTLSNVMVRGSTIGHFIVYKDISSLTSENQVLQKVGKLAEAYLERILAHYNSE
ncbi:MAG: LuxR C-terminal-related transcriptional regulator, partial [Armatimonadota bacterium]